MKTILKIWILCAFGIFMMSRMPVFAWGISCDYYDDEYYDYDSHSDKDIDYW